MPITKEALQLVPIHLKIDGDVIIDSINSNEFHWQFDKTREALIKFADALTDYEKKDVTQEYVCKQAADVFIQLAITEHLISLPTIQNFVNTRLVSIHNRTERRTKRSSFKDKIGFTPLDET